MKDNQREYANLSEMIFRRKSTRSFTDEPVDEETLQKIREFSTKIAPLYPEIRVRSEIVGKESIKCIFPWTTPQQIAVFSEEIEGALENVGFLFQQMDLFLQSLGLGVCWLGMGKLNSQGIVETRHDDGLRYVIMLAFGYPKGEALRRDVKEFKRRTLSNISDRPDERLEPARLAPSSVNSQPWYFTHDDDAHTIHAYCAQPGLFKNKALGDMNHIDMGIALAHLYVSNPDIFRFFQVDQPKPVKNHQYIGSFRL